jgi:hypothetical protein
MSKSNHMHGSEKLMMVKIVKQAGGFYEYRL